MQAFLAGIIFQIKTFLNTFYVILYKLFCKCDTLTICFELRYNILMFTPDSYPICNKIIANIFPTRLYKQQQSLPYDNC